MSLITPLSHVYRCLCRLLIFAIFRLVCLVCPPLDSLLKRCKADPGLPVPNPSDSYWINPPSPIAKHGSSPDSVIPDYADIVIIGSGITGTSIARTLLDYDAEHNTTKRPLSVVMLEARDACSGATGRNGGHVTPILYQDYEDLKRRHGKEVAVQIMRFRLAHLDESLAVATKEGLLQDSQCRKVRSYDVFGNSTFYRHAKRLFKVYAQDLPGESSDFEIIETEEGLKELQLSPTMVGCLSSPGGAIHPYRLVTGILARLLDSYQDSFHLFTHTPCIDILASTPENDLFTVVTDRISIRARHVVHATNSWASHLLPGMRGKILPARVTMSAQFPRKGFGVTKNCNWTGMRSFIFFPGSSFDQFDYLTQQLPPSEKYSPSIYPSPSSELMLGVSLMQNRAYLTDLGNADDSAWNPSLEDHLKSAMEDYFCLGEKDRKDTFIGIWSGILSMSVDGCPWIGRVPDTASGRRLQACAQRSAEANEQETVQLAQPGEWIAAGYSGEGMVHAWMSGKVLGYMILGTSREGEQTDPGKLLPDVFLVTEERCRKASLEELLVAHV